MGPVLNFDFQQFGTSMFKIEGNELIRLVLVTPRAAEFGQLEPLFCDVQIQRRVRFAAHRLRVLRGDPAVRKR